jgi:hypothetical protein
MTKKQSFQNVVEDDCVPVQYAAHLSQDAS